MRAAERIRAEVRAVSGSRYCTSCQQDRDPAGFVHVNHKRWVCAGCNQRRLANIKLAPHQRRADQ